MLIPFPSLLHLVNLLISSRRTQKSCQHLNPDFQLQIQSPKLPFHFTEEKTCQEVCGFAQDHTCECPKRGLNQGLLTLKISPFPSVPLCHSMTTERLISQYFHLNFVLGMKDCMISRTMLDLVRQQLSNQISGGQTGS